MKAVNRDVAAYVVARIKAETEGDRGANRRVAAALGVSDSYITQVKQTGKMSSKLARAAAKHWGLTMAQLDAKAIEWTAGQPGPAAESSAGAIGPRVPGDTVLDAALTRALELMSSRWLPQTASRLVAIGSQWPTDRTLDAWIADGDAIDRALRRATAAELPRAEHARATK